MDSADQRIVTLASLQPRTSTAESETEPAEPVEPLSPKDQLNLARYQQVRARLREVTKTAGGGVVVTVQDQEASLVQSVLAEIGTETRPAESGGEELQFATGGPDVDPRWLSVLYEKVAHLLDKHPMVRPATPEPETLSGNFRLAMAADWATGLYGAPVIAKTMSTMGADRPFDLLMHLGDVYYSGTPAEVDERFLRCWPNGAGVRNRALNGNHDMYAGGHGYFDQILQAFSQNGSYFALQNEHWLLVGLDTAYEDHAMDGTQVAWLNLVIEQAGGDRKVVLFSHHQPFSRLSSQGPKLQDALRHHLEAGTITAWYWGHEHQCVIYDKHESWGMYGRCLGNGGVPEPRPNTVTNAELDPAHHGVGELVWRRLSATVNAPGSIVLDGPNRDMKKPSHQRRFGPHGFMTLTFEGPALFERVHLSDGTELLYNTIA